jgi:transcriptional regulator with GAF, ATPase, and Fis domain
MCDKKGYSACERIILGTEVWEKVFASPLYLQIIGLLRYIFKREFGFVDIPNLNEELIEQITGSPLKPPIPFQFCNLINDTPKGRELCQLDAEQSFARLSSTGKVDICTCFAGLTEISVPIMLHGKYCGAMAIDGGVLLHEPTQQEWEEICQRVKQTGVDLDRLRKAYFDITPISRELLDVMIKLLSVAIEEIIKTAVEIEAHKRQISELESALYERYQFGNIIGKSKPMRELFGLLEKVIQSDSTVLIQGETGTGKELVARAIHFNSRRKDQRFVIQNCAAMSEQLLESELFGHVRGAFTGALRDKPGLFEVADGGTFFLDEIAELTPAIQAKLLRVLENGEIRRIGAEKTLKVDVRIIAATNKDLEELVNQGRFREDLYYRLKVVNIFLPPLRERREDIPLLIDHFLKFYSTRAGKRLEIDKEAQRLLYSYPWPGNVRELENEIQRAVILAKEKITPELLSSEIHRSNLGPTIKPAKLREYLTGKTLQEVERELFLGTLQKTNWNISAAARILGMPWSTLHDKIRRYGLSRQ